MEVVASQIYASQTQLLECLRDIWPSQKGLAALLFQNDLFCRIRRIEIKVEGGDPEDAVGFLPEDYPEWSAPEEYKSIWIQIEGEAAFDATGPLDALEDAVCGWVEDMVPDSCAFFDAALDTGYLDEKWLHAAEMLRDLEGVKTVIGGTQVPGGPVLSTQVPVEVKEAEVLSDEVKESVTIEPIVPGNQVTPEVVISAVVQKHRSNTRRLRRVGRPLTPSFRKKIRSTRRNKLASKSGQ